jgi:hypothetical protein
VTLIEYIEKLEGLEKAASGPPWKFRYVPQYDQTLRCVDNKTDNIFTTAEGPAKSDLKFIAAARNALPALLEIIKVQHEALEFFANKTCIETKPIEDFLNGSQEIFEDKGDVARSAIKKCNEIIEGEK